MDSINNTPKDLGDMWMEMHSHLNKVPYGLPHVPLKKSNLSQITFILLQFNPQVFNSQENIPVYGEISIIISFLQSVLKTWFWTILQDNFFSA